MRVFPVHGVSDSMDRLRNVPKHIGRFMAPLLVAAFLAAQQAAALESFGGKAAPASLPVSGTVPVMTYNVKGLPWPIARDRSTELVEIGTRLAAMRASGKQPHVVMLQESFGAVGAEIAKLGGYRYWANGPDKTSAGTFPAMGQSFAAQADWLRGEGIGSVLDSGLAILSDYPISSVRRVSFPRGACAGYDCLAAKGLLLASIRVPGLEEPVVFADTHLNSRRASGVSRERADAAFAFQASFVAKTLDRVAPHVAGIILAGDTNVGRSVERRTSWQAAKIGDMKLDGLVHRLPDNELAAIARRNKDKIIPISGKGVRPIAIDAYVPFPIERESRPLSDHAGLVVTYRFDMKG